MEAKQAAANGKQGKADMALSFIQKLYRIETQIKDKTPQEKQLIRQQQAQPILERFKQWLDKSSTQVLPKSKLGEAINYNLNQWHKLFHYLDDGLLNIDNSRASNKAVRDWQKELDVQQYTERRTSQCQSVFRYRNRQSKWADAVRLSDHAFNGITEKKIDR